MTTNLANLDNKSSSIFCGSGVWAHTGHGNPQPGLRKAAIKMSVGLAF